MAHEQPRELPAIAQAEIFPRSETEFFFKVAQADITFTKDENGSVTGLTLKQAGRTFTGEKVE